MTTLETVRVYGHYFSSWRHERWSQWVALCELIDNAIDARSSNVVVTFDKARDRIDIIDDGVGSDNIARFFNLGDTKGHDASQRLGRFGMGGVRAGCYLSDRVHVLTRHRGVERSGTVHWTRSIEQATELQFERGKERATREHSGTHISLFGIRSGLERYKGLFDDYPQAMLRAELAMTYGPALRSGRLNLTVGGDRVLPMDYPACESSPALVYEGEYGGATFSAHCCIARQGELGNNWTNGIYLECAGRLISRVSEKQKRRRAFEDGLDDYIGAPVWILVRLHESSESPWPLTPDKTDITCRTEFLEWLCAQQEAREFLDEAQGEGEALDIQIATEDFADLLCDVFGGEVIGGRRERRESPESDTGAVQPAHSGARRTRASKIHDDQDGSIESQAGRSLLWRINPEHLGADGPVAQVRAATPKGVLRVTVALNMDIQHVSKHWRTDWFKRHVAAFIVPGGVAEEPRAGQILWEKLKPGSQPDINGELDHRCLMELSSVILNRLDRIEAARGGRA
ncbi:MAG: Histidine kinase, gyrase and HSP90-like ATPase [Pseudomonadota bacterium]|jgi:hypothetical protein